jgi:ribosomal protein L32E
MLLRNICSNKTHTVPHLRRRHPSGAEKVRICKVHDLHVVTPELNVSTCPVLSSRKFKSKMASEQRIAFSSGTRIVTYAFTVTQ